MSPHKPTCSGRKVEVDFVEILARAENNEPQPHEPIGYQPVGSAKNRIESRQTHIRWSSAANMFFAVIAFFGALIGTLHFLGSPEYLRRLHTGSPREFLYPRPESEIESGQFVGRANSSTGSAFAHHEQQSSDATTTLFRDLASTNPMLGAALGSVANANFSSPLTLNQSADNFANAARSVADQSTNIGQSAMSAMHSVTGERESTTRRRRSIAETSRNALMTRPSLIDSNARRGHSPMFASLRSIGSNSSAMQNHSGLNVNHIQNRTMTGGLVSHALHAGDFGGNVQVRHHGARH